MCAKDIMVSLILILCYTLVLKLHILGQIYYPCYANTFIFLSADVDGNWGSWKDTTCSSSCKGGTRTRTRKCNNPIPLNEGKQCLGLEEEEIPCNTETTCCK